MGWRLIVGAVVGAVGALFSWFFLRMAWIAVPRADCDWSRDPQEIMCSDNGPLYWGLFAVTVSATVLILWLLLHRRKRD